MKTKKTIRTSPTITRYTPAEPPPQPRPDGSAENDAIVITEFSGRGIPVVDIQPRVNVLTFHGWLKAGRAVRQGERGVKINGRHGSMTVFHISQTSEKAAVATPAVPAMTPPAFTQPDGRAVVRPKLPAWVKRRAAELTYA
ncbi:MAG TPA: hypothetical protein VHH73_03325 [Verrucomicrobiae bacterium]|nr:hypothetical protein [Verrucomicrobiae bacterium]